MTNPQWARSTLCTRTTRAGTPCTHPQTAWRPGNGVPKPPSCRWHFTSEEKQHWEEEKRAEAERSRTAHAALLLREPDCWTWDVPDRSAYRSDWLYFKAFHAGRCSMCGDIPEFSHHLHTDHHHACGLARGQLCASCNVQEGFAKEFDSGRGWANYYLRPPTLILGLRLTYNRTRPPRGRPDPFGHNTFPRTCPWCTARLVQDDRKHHTGL